ncbi:MAG: hypothetical protein ACRCYX_08045 [Dermatophilaceae bacterium]
MMSSSIEMSTLRRARHAKAGGMVRWMLRDVALLSIGRGSTHVGRHAAEITPIRAEADPVSAAVRAA